MGGLGHLGVQFAAKIGFNTVAIARGAAPPSIPKTPAKSPLPGRS
jgi:D-arabinose 1-dehydrogenase-like Zn-dependent alcohol dehydrogenase